MCTHTPYGENMNVAQTSPAIRLRVEEFRKRARKAGLVTDDDIADRLGMARTSVWRVMNGKVAPGESFIASALTAFPRTRFEHFFEVVGGSQDARGAA